MRAVIVLCDFAEQEAGGGKVHMLGAGWSVTGPFPTQHAVVILIKVGWNESNRQHQFVLKLTDGDGRAVMVPNPVGGAQPLEIPGQLEVGRPPGLPEGSEIDASFVIQLQPLPLPGGQRYTWRLEMGTEVLATEGFYMRPGPQFPQPPADPADEPPEN